MSILRTLSPSNMGIYYIWDTQQIQRYWNIFPKVAIILSKISFMNSNKEYMIMILLVMIGSRLLTPALMHSAWWIMPLSAGCIRLDLQIIFHLQQPHPSKNNLKLITLRYPLIKYLNCLFYSNNRPNGTVVILIPLQLTEPRAFRTFLTKLMFRQLLMELTYSEKNRDYCTQLLLKYY